MSPATHDQYEVLQAAFADVGQAHVFAFWDQLGESQRAHLLADLACIDVAAVPGLSKLVQAGSSEGVNTGDIEPAPVIARDAVDEAVVEQGRTLIAEGRVAAFTVAGGQGTRLGFDGPKGAFPISPVRNKPLFQLFAESIRGTESRYGSQVMWYIMTSPVNDEATRSFFQQHEYFGQSPDRVRFFKQGVMPAFDRQGRILLDRPHRVALAPDGHGGSLLALARTGTLADMAERGIDYISYFQVDNPLVACVDPVFIGVHAANNAEMSSKALPKADDVEKVGNFVVSGGRQTVIEYSDFPEDLARARNANGSRMYDAGNIAIHVLSRSFVERLTADAAAFALPWHLADKKVPFVDLASGKRIEPDAPNATKLESFVFDALPLAENPVLLGTVRAEEFSPVKNKSGVDSVETARNDLSSRAGRWLAAAKIEAPAEATCEIDPLAALDGDHLVERLSLESDPFNVERGANGGIYLGPKS